jgi:hypothetical protein
MHFRILFLFVALSLLSGCSGENGYSIGNKFWQIELPENYRSNLKAADTLTVNTICGLELPGEMIQLFEIQEANAKDSLPVPNACTAFIAQRDFLKQAKMADCALEIEQMYAYIFGMHNVNYEGKRKNLKIDGIPFIEIDNLIYSEDGSHTHGDMHYLGEIDQHVLHIQMSYRDEKHKEKLKQAILSSRFSD